jgi:hypothetical protein
MEVPLHDGFPVAPLSRQRIVDVAINAREVLGLDDGRLNIPRLLDELTSRGVYYDVFDRESAPVPRAVEACYVPEDRTLYIRDEIYDQMCSGGQRAVFTLGHELGHALLAHRRTYNRLTVRDVPVYCNSEWQANCFAAEFTMPLDQIRRYRLSAPSEISSHFGVSLAAARIRYEDLSKRGELKKKP